MLAFKTKLNFSAKLFTADDCDEISCTFWLFVYECAKSKQNNVKKRVHTV